MHIGVFCSANNQIDADYFALTEAFGRWMGEQGHTLVFGGTNLGLMEAVAKAAHGAGATVVGVVPDIVERGGRSSAYNDVTLPVDNLDDRKQLMVAKSDVLVALPGGVGTLDEIFTVVAARSIGYHSKTVVLFNMKGFWDSLIALLDDLQRRGLMRGDWHDSILVGNTLDEVTTLIDAL